MNFKIFCFIFTVLFCEIVTLHVPAPFNGKCPTFENCTDKNFKFDAQKFIGYQYLISSVPYFFQTDQKCTWFNFTQASKTSLLMQKYETDIETHKLRSTDGVVDYKDDGNAKLIYTELELPLNFKVVQQTSEYAVVLSCHDCGFFSKNGAGIYAFGMTKIPWPSCDIIKAINDKLQECGIAKEHIKIENQDGCTKCSTKN